MPRSLLCGLAFATTLSCACSGTVVDSGARGQAAGLAPGTTSLPTTLPPPGPASSPDGGSSATCEESAPAVLPLRRLTRAEYSNTVRDLLGDDSDPGKGLPSDDAGEELFVSPATMTVTTDWAQSALETAEAIARRAVAKLPTLVPCASAGDEVCAQQFIGGFGRRAFRRPLLREERDRLLALWKSGAGESFARGVELVVSAVLQAPSFLYRIEFGAAGVGGKVTLSPYEVATRLSYGLWGTTPDLALLAAAEADQLNTGTQVAAHAQRMLGDPRAQHNLTAFVGRWFGLAGLEEVMKDPAVYPAFNEKLIEAMKEEVDHVIDETLWKGDGRSDTLLTAPFTFVNRLTAPLYGVPAPQGEGFTKVTLDGNQRAGLLTNAAILTAHTFSDASAPIHRGKFVRERLLCTIPPAPPADVNIVPPVPRPGLSTRDRLREHSDVPACRACHTFMDAIGFGFGNYDGLGRYSTKDPQGQPVDNRGELLHTDNDGAFQGVPALAARLTASTMVSDCIASTFLRFVSGTESEIDACARQKLRAAFTSANHDVRKLIVAIAATDAFRHRRALPGEVSP
ncbi:MAG TPA: DUF1592 domain-containing protein [Polyangia bacterium]